MLTYSELASAMADKSPIDRLDYARHLSEVFYYFHLGTEHADCEPDTLESATFLHELIDTAIRDVQRELLAADEKKKIV